MAGKSKRKNKLELTEMENVVAVLMDEGYSLLGVAMRIGVRRTIAKGWMTKVKNKRTMAELVGMELPKAELPADWAW